MLDHFSLTIFYPDLWLLPVAFRDATPLSFTLINQVEKGVEGTGIKNIWDPGIFVISQCKIFGSQFGWTEGIDRHQFDKQPIIGWVKWHS